MWVLQKEKCPCFLVAKKEQASMHQASTCPTNTSNYTKLHDAINIKISTLWLQIKVDILILT